MYVMAGWIWGLSAGRGIVENNDCGVGGVVNDDALESENVGDGVRGLQGGDSPAVLWTAFMLGSKTRTRLPWRVCMSSSGSLGGCGGGGKGLRGDKRGKPRRYNLICLDGAGCTTDPSKDGYYPRVEIAPSQMLRHLRVYPGGYTRSWRRNKS